MTETLKKILFPIVTLVIILFVWDWTILLFHVPNYLVPRPWTVISALTSGYIIEGNLWPQLAYTCESVVLGYVMGCAVGICVGALLAESRLLEIFTYPIVVAFKSTPKVALAPLVMVWCGFGIESKIVMVALVCFFPLFVNTFVGLRQTNQDQIDLMRVYAATKSHIFMNVKLPSALDMIFAGLQISIVMALIGAIVAEFVASSQGLGYVISSNSVDLHLGTMFAAILSLSLLGVIGNTLVRHLQLKLVFWGGEAQQDSVVIGTA
ncbi:MAG TPA: ABC transporter permease [Stellaceae bacterium]|nr:ABC transporter permease [Stellaceae bacterium]